MKKQALITVCGILSSIEDARAWTRLFTSRWEHADPQHRTGLSYVYYTSVTAGADSKTTDRMASEIAKLILDYPHAFIAGHSHGCRIIRRAFEMNTAAVAKQVTLIAAADYADCFGWNNIAHRRQVGKVRILYSPKDSILKQFGTLPGYGQLGLYGPAHVSPDLAEIIEPKEFDCDHGGYFNATNVDRVYGLCTTGDQV